MGALREPPAVHTWYRLVAQQGAQYFPYDNGRNDGESGICAYDGR